MVCGDLRLNAEDPTRPHAVGFFVDGQKHLWLVDGMIV
jgi:hypothetical protein